MTGPHPVPALAASRTELYNAGMGMPPVPMLVYALAMIASRFAFRHRERVAASGGSSARSISWRGALLCLLPIGLMQLGPFIEYVLRAQGWLQPQLSDPMAFPSTATSGLLVFAVGTALAAVGIWQMAGAWHRDPNALCTSGLYSAIRHPMYAGYLVQGAGCALMLGALWSWALYGLALLMIFVRIVIEDRELAGSFPAAFPAYRDRVKRLVPFVF